MFCKLFNSKPKNKPRDRVIHAPAKEVRSVPSSWVQTALDITGSFEGAGFSGVSGNFDGQGISAGIMQWNIGQGSLQSKILRPLIRQIGIDIDSFFSVPVSPLLSMTNKEGIAYAKKHMLNGKKLKDEWRIHFARLLGSEYGVKVQINACESIANKADCYCKLYEMDNIHAFCFFFDLVVQNGGLRGIKPRSYASSKIDYLTYLSDPLITDDIKQSWQSAPKSEQSFILFDLLMRRVKRNKWANDVIMRKGAIIHRRGLVHGKNINLYDVLPL